MKIFERLQREEQIAEREQKRLRDFAWSACSQKRLQSLSIEQLRAAAALKGHEGHLGMVGMFAESELKRRSR